MMDLTSDNSAETAPPEPVMYPPKYQPQTQAGSGNTAYRTVLSLVLYIGFGYLLFRSWSLLLLLTGIVLIHEAGHFIAMRYYKYADTGIFFVPLIGAFVSGSKREISQRQNAVILMAGPLPGIIIGLLLMLLGDGTGILDIPVAFIAQLFIWLNLLNLLPVYPLDGGQLLNRVYLDEEGLLSNIFIILSAALMAVLAFYLKFYVLLIFPALLLFRFTNTRKHHALEKKLSATGVDLDQSYEDLADADYWKIRTVVVEYLPALHDVPPGPPYDYHAKEDRVAQAVEDALQRNLLQDMNLAGKILLAIIWIAALLSPFIAGYGFTFFRYFGR